MAGFVQIIEMQSSRFDEIQMLANEVRARLDDGRPISPHQSDVTADQHRPGHYVNIVEFDSYEAAMENSSRPEVTEFAARRSSWPSMRGGSTWLWAAPTSSSTAGRARPRSGSSTETCTASCTSRSTAGWGRHDTFTMGPGYVLAAGIRQIVSGTPPILAAVPLLAALDLLEQAGIAAVRAKSVALTGFVLELVDAWLAPHGVELMSPRDPRRRGGHVTIRRTGFRELVDALWERGVLPDYREPDAIRIGPAPLSTSLTEVHDGLAVLHELLHREAG